MATDSAFDLLRDAEPLSQVVFVHDYLQLIFQGLTFTIFPMSAITLGPRGLSRKHQGFCDALVALIDHRVANTEIVKNESFSVLFDDGTHFKVSLDQQHAVGPEIMQLEILHGQSFIWRYDE